MTSLVFDPLTVAEAARIMREAVKDKSYQLLPMGEEAARYLRAKRKQLTDSSYRGYEGTLDKLARHFPDLELADFELPRGGERLEEFLDDRWGDQSPGTYNSNHAVLSDFFRWQVKRGRMHSNPMIVVDRARKRDVYRRTFSNDQRRALIASSPDLEDRLCLRLLFDYGLRKGSLRAVQIKHFDLGRRQLAIFAKGGKVRQLPIPDKHFWYELEQIIEPIGVLKPNDYLLHVRRPVPRAGVYATPGRQLSDTAAHEWFKRCMKRAGIVSDGRRTAHMHMARHTAGQRVLDATGNLKAVQKLLGHASIQTTGDVYADWDIEQLAASLAIVLEGDDE